MRAMNVRAAASLPLLVLLAGCVKERDVLPARLDIAAAQACASQPTMTAARPLLQPDKDKPLAATVRFDETAPCVTDAKGNKSVYAVVDLSTGAAGSIVTVTSYPMGSTVFSPRLEFRDAQGALLRSVGRETFLYSGAQLQTQLRQREGERYLVIASDGESVGQSVERIQSTRSSTMVAAGPVMVPVNTGGEFRAQMVFAYNGEVSVTVEAIRKEK